jgi:O-acetylhomoserine/O-acetylserine sulfhydrylase-like pyridoxal-dependent enzyme
MADHAQASYAPIRHVDAPCRRRAGSRHRFSRNADLSNHVVRLPDTDHAAALFNMERAGHVYSRISNPTCAVLEERIAALEGGVGSIATASGQAALHLAIVTLMGAGAHIVASRALYGGSHNLLDYTLPRFGIATTFVDPRDVDAWRNAIRPETRLLFGETLGNPGLDVLDIPRVAALAHDHGLPLLVDSTFTTPGSFDRSTMAPTSCSTPRRNSSRVTAC